MRNPGQRTPQGHLGHPQQHDLDDRAPGRRRRGWQHGARPSMTQLGQTRHGVALHGLQRGLQPAPSARKRTIWQSGQTDKQVSLHLHRDLAREADKTADRATNRQSGKQAGRHTNRQTESKN